MNTPTSLSASAAPTFPVLSGRFADTFELPPLPYGVAALKSVISADTMRIHYGKHHKGYVDALNKLIPGTEFTGLTLEQIILASADGSEHEQVFHNAAQAWNHTFYWHSLTPHGGGEAGSALQPFIRTSFGDTAALKRELATAASNEFGSGWVWLVLDEDRLKVVKTDNAGNVLTRGLVPLLVIDVWEHAYYLDVLNRRADYVAGVLDKLLNWDFAAENLNGAIAQRRSGLL
jgi:superoxide dismutase, Fe-Mn family